MADESNEVIMDESAPSKEEEAKEVVMEDSAPREEEETEALMDVSSEESEESSEESTDESSEEYAEYSDKSTDEESDIESREASGDAAMEESAEESSADRRNRVADEDLEADTLYSIEICYDAARVQAKDKQIEHLFHSINKADCSDVEFICKDGDKVYASKVLCLGRSEMLDAMFKSGMSESQSSVIKLPEICSRSLLAIIEFLYLAHICRHRPSGWKTGLEILDAAHFFLLSFVDKIVEKYLLEFVKDIGENLQQAADMLSMAMEYKFPFQGDRYVSLLRLVHLLRGKWMHKDCVFHLSEQAIDFILRHTRCKELRSRDRMKISFDEYLRFREVLIWAICNSHVVSTDDAEELFNRTIPGTKEKLCCKGREDCSQKKLVWLPGYKVSSTKNRILHILESHQACKEAAVRLLLTNIDWARIPPQLFVRIVEPLKLLPDCQLLDIFRCHFKQRKTYECPFELDSQ